MANAKSVLAKVFCLGTGVCFCVAGAATGAKAWTYHIGAGYHYFHNEIKDFTAASASNTGSRTASFSVSGISAMASMERPFIGGALSISGKAVTDFFAGSWKNFVTDQYGNYVDSSSVSGGTTPVAGFGARVKFQYEHGVYSWSKMNLSGLGFARYDFYLAAIALPDSSVPYENTYELWNGFTAGFGVKATEVGPKVWGKQLRFSEEVDLEFPLYTRMTYKYEWPARDPVLGTLIADTQKVTYHLGVKPGYRVALGCTVGRFGTVEVDYEVMNYKGDTETENGKTYSIGDVTNSEFDVFYKIKW